jgi:hypothetical protein
MSFLAAWRVAEAVRGWLSEQEAQHLYAAAIAMPIASDIVEVGAFHGKSTVLLANTGRRIFTIDPMLAGEDPVNQMAISDSDADNLQRNISPYANVTWIRARSCDCELPSRSIGLLYIDGPHQYPEPRQDFERFASVLAPDAFVAFHDYGEFPGVTRTVQELEATGRLKDGVVCGSMYIGRVGRHVAVDAGNRPSNDSSPSRTGRRFHLIGLCHRFGRRARAFAHSLATQASTDVQLHLTVFYSDASDARLILEGATSGRRSPEISLIRVPPETIMQRAIHFAHARIDDSCSHTVFLDTDLWFPQTFWQDYSEALDLEVPGYWSCRVKEIDARPADLLVDAWAGLTVETLEAVSVGVRHDSFNGMVGHFQCIPTRLLPYPADAIRAVNRADEIFAVRAVALSRDGRPDRRIGKTSAFHLGHPFCWAGTSALL